MMIIRHLMPGTSVQDADFPLRILVQSDMIGAIIGRSGNTIKHITHQSKARIDVHRDESQDQQEKVISITGSPESCTAACSTILEIILNEKMQANNKDGSSTDLDNPTSAKSYDDNAANVHNNEQQKQATDYKVQLKILAHNNFIGRLIGRSGASIKRIMATTSTKINVSVSNMADCSHERIITVIGNLEHVRLAEQIISSKLRTAFLSDMNNTLQNMNHQQPILFGNMPLPYMATPYAQNPLLSGLVNSHAGHAMSRTGVPVGSHHQSQSTGPPLYPGASSYRSLYPNMNVAPTGHSILGFNSAVPGSETEKETVDIYIPNMMVGAIIGKSGSAIKEMIINSGASIKVAAAPTLPTIGPAQPASVSKDENRSDIRELTETDSSGPAPISDSSDQDQVLSDSQTPTVKSQERVSSSRQTTAASDPQVLTRKVTIVGTPESQWSAQYLIYRKVSMENNKSDISLMVEIQVPSQLVGRIIGKGGKTIRQIQKQTRTTIRLPDEKPSSSEIENDSETSVQITGDFHCSQLAQRHIRNLIKKSSLSSARQNNNSTSSKPSQSNKEPNENNNIATESPNAQANFNDNNNLQHRIDNESVSSLDGEDNESNKSN